MRTGSPGTRGSTNGGTNGRSTAAGTAEARPRRYNREREGHGHHNFLDPRKNMKGTKQSRWASACKYRSTAPPAAATKATKGRSTKKGRWASVCNNAELPAATPATTRSTKSTVDRVVYVSPRLPDEPKRVKMFAGRRLRGTVLPPDAEDAQDAKLPDAKRVRFMLPDDDDELEVLWREGHRRLVRKDVCGMEDDEILTVLHELRCDADAGAAARHLEPREYMEWCRTPAFTADLRRYLSRWCTPQIADASPSPIVLLVLMALRRRELWHLYEDVLAHLKITGDRIRVLWCDVCGRNDGRLDDLLKELRDAEDPSRVTRPSGDLGETWTSDALAEDEDEDEREKRRQYLEKRREERNVQKSVLGYVYLHS